MSPPGQVLAVTFTQRAAGEMRARLRALGAAAQTGVGAVQALTFHAAAHRQLRYFWPRVVGDTGWQLLDSKFAVVARAASRAGLQAEHRRRARPGRRDRVGQGVADRPRAVPGRRGRSRPRHPAGRRQGRGGLRRLRGAEGPRRRHCAARLRRPAAAHRGRDRERRRGRRGVPGPLPLLRRRRIPGRHAAAAAGAVGVAGRSRRPDRRRRRQPDHLLVHRGLAALPAGLLAAVPRRHRGAAGARLPVHPAGGVAGQPGDRRGPRPGRRQQAAPGRPARRRARARRSASIPTRSPRPPRWRHRSRGSIEAGTPPRRSLCSTGSTRSPRSTRRR